MAAGYEVAVKGVEDGSLRSLLESVSNTFTYKNRPPATTSLLEHRARTDIPEMIQALRSLGYYDAAIDLSVDVQKKPLLVTFHVEPGPVYRLESVKIEETTGVASTPSVKLPSPRDLGLELKRPAEARPIADAGTKLIQIYRNHGFAFAAVKDRRVVVDHATKLVAVTFQVDPGPAARFGPTATHGLESVNEKFVLGLLPWHEGDRFDAELLTQLQKRLVETRLFSLVQISHAESLDKEGRLPISIQLKERAQRSISAGVTYHTDEGPGVKFAWEHRNLFHGGEQLKLQVGASGFGYSGEGLFRKPQFLRNDQTFSIPSRLAKDDTNAFVSNNLDTAMLVEREIHKGLRVGLGPGFRVSQVELEADPLKIKKEYALASFRTFCNWDTTDNLLDPTRGARLDVQLAPFLDTLDANLGFVKGRVEYRHYFMISNRPYLLFAGRAAFGSIVGAGRDAIPADLRYYAGGGGSIRGYAFQLAGPLVGEDPIGGASALELSAELRTKVTEKIGFVVFLDGGSAFKPSLPDFNTTLRWGGGVGARYYTPIGPLRLDFAVPLNPRDGVDDPFQVYVSIGQAF